MSKAPYRKAAFFMFSEYGSTLFLARRLKQEGHPVLLYIREESAQDVGKGLVPKTTNPVPPRDYIVVFDSVGHGKVGQELRKAGHRVIGGNPLDKALEADRPEGARIMQRHGIRTPQAFEFRAIPTAIKFLDGKDGHWFVKAIGTDTPESATYDAPVEELQRYLRTLTGKLEHFQLSKKAHGTEISTNGWFDGEKWVPPFDHTIEEKRFATGNLGPRTGCESNLVWFTHSPTLPQEMLLPLEGLLRREGYVGPLDLNALIDSDGNPLGLEWCYSEDTEVLTASGWRVMADLRVGDLVNGLNDQGDLVEVPVLGTSRLRWTRDLLHIHSKTVYDLLVTPNHRMVLQREDGTLYFKAAQYLSRHGERTKRTAVWGGEDRPLYTIPAYSEMHATGRHHGTYLIDHKKIDLPMEDWCRFLGLFVAEGNLHFKGHGRPYQVNIAQSKFVEPCEAIIAMLGWPYHYAGHSFTISSIQLGTHLLDLFGRTKAPEKRMPRFILSLSSRYIQAFLDGFLLGDGSIHKRTKQRTYHTSSSGLADDIGECLLRTGKWGRISRRTPNSHAFGNRPMYAVHERTFSDGRIFAGRHIRSVPYSGWVVCLTVPHNRLYVRRAGGPPLWCGNTARLGFDAFQAWSHLLPMVGEQLEAFAEGSLGAWEPLGTDFAITLRVSMPPYPLWEPRVAQKSKGLPLDPKWLTSPTLTVDDVMLGPDGLQMAGRDGYIGTVGAVGDDLATLKREVLEQSKTIRVPNKHYRTDPVSRAMKDLKELARLGLMGHVGLEKQVRG